MLIPALERVQRAVMAVMSGQTAEAAQADFDREFSGDYSMSNLVAAMLALAEAARTTGTQIQSTKLNDIFTLAVAAAEISYYISIAWETLGASLLWIPAVEGLTMVAVRQLAAALVRRIRVAVAEALTKTALWNLVKAAAVRSAVGAGVGGALGLGQEGLIEAGQILAGHRDSFDLTEIGQSFASGLVGGIGGALTHGAVESVLGHANTILTKALHGALTHYTSGLVGNLAGSLPTGGGMSVQEIFGGAGGNALPGIAGEAFSKHYGGSAAHLNELVDHVGDNDAVSNLHGSPPPYTVGGSPPPYTAAGSPPPYSAGGSAPPSDSGGTNVVRAVDPDPSSAQPTTSHTTTPAPNPSDTATPGTGGPAPNPSDTAAASETGEPAPVRTSTAGHDTESAGTQSVTNGAEHASAAPPSSATRTSAASAAPPTSATRTSAASAAASTTATPSASVASQQSGSAPPKATPTTETSTPPPEGAHATSASAPPPADRSQQPGSTNPRPAPESLFSQADSADKPSTPSRASGHSDVAKPQLPQQNHDQTGSGPRAASSPGSTTPAAADHLAHSTPDPSPAAATTSHGDQQSGPIVVSESPVSVFDAWNTLAHDDKSRADWVLDSTIKTLTAAEGTDFSTLSSDEIDEAGEVVKRAYGALTDNQRAEFAVTTMAQAAQMLHNQVLYGSPYVGLRGGARRLPHPAPDLIQHRLGCRRERP
ncbi:hypothetical protein, partial [Mycobacterium sp. 1245801.1]|uniref:hypothetical protein n=1 Tax=Mycobacterium sp. 1245801.1 TaxID=1834075 RepID=UPI000A3E82B1